MFDARVDWRMSDGLDMFFRACINKTPARVWRSRQLVGDPRASVAPAVACLVGAARQGENSVMRARLSRLDVTSTLVICGDDT